MISKKTLKKSTLKVHVDYIWLRFCEKVRAELSEKSLPLATALALETLCLEMPSNNAMSSGRISRRVKIVT